MPTFDEQGKQITQGTGMVQDFDPESHKDYLDPYQDYVTQGIEKQYDTAINQANLGAAGKGAFGGSRQGIMNAELLGGKALGVGQSLSQGFGTAMGLARGDFENKMQRYGTAAGMTQQLGQGDIASLMGAGSIEQQRNQQVMDADYQAMLTNRYDPMQRFGFMSDIFPRRTVRSNVNDHGNLSTNKSPITGARRGNFWSRSRTGLAERIGG